MIPMVYLKSALADYDRWAELGHVDWGWVRVEPYFAEVRSKLCIDLRTPSFKLYNYVDK